MKYIHKHYIYAYGQMSRRTLTRVLSQEPSVVFFQTRIDL